MDIGCKKTKLELAIFMLFLYKRNDFSATTAMNTYDIVPMMSTAAKSNQFIRFEQENVEDEYLKPRSSTSASDNNSTVSSFTGGIAVEERGNPKFIDVPTGGKSSTLQQQGGMQLLREELSECLIHHWCFITLLIRLNVNNIIVFSVFMWWYHLVIANVAFQIYSFNRNNTDQWVANKSHSTTEAICTGEDISELCEKQKWSGEAKAVFCRGSSIIAVVDSGATETGKRIFQFVFQRSWYGSTFILESSIGIRESH